MAYIHIRLQKVWNCAHIAEYIAHMLGIYCHSGFGFHPYNVPYIVHDLPRLIFLVLLCAAMCFVVVLLLFRNWFSTIIALLKFDSYKNRIVFIRKSLISTQQQSQRFFSVYLTCSFHHKSFGSYSNKVHKHKQINGMNRKRFYLCVRLCIWEKTM